jgi:hypothetical protein
MQAKNPISQVVERIDGYHGIYTDRLGNTCKVKGTFAFGFLLSWYDEQGNYMVICGHDQKRLVDTSETVREQ